MRRRRRILLNVAAATMVVAALAGCSSKGDRSETKEGVSQEILPTAGAEHDTTPDMLMPASTIAGLWAQIRGEQTRLSAAIQSRRPEEVHRIAFAIRDLVDAVTRKASAAAPESAGRLAGYVDQVRSSTTALDESGAAGDLSGAMAEDRRLDAILTAIRNVTGEQ